MGLHWNFGRDATSDEASLAVWNQRLLVMHPSVVLADRGIRVEYVGLSDKMLE